MQSDRVNRLAEILRLLAEPSRLRILLSLGLECRPVSDVVRATGMTQSNVSFHLRLLREAGLVRPERRGPFVYYCLPDPELLRILERLEQWIEARDRGAARTAGDEKRESIASAESDRDTTRQRYRGQP